MRKWLVLLFLVMLMAGSWVAYTILTEQVTTGSAKLAAGQQQIDEGEKMLADGKARLARGQQKLSAAKRSFGGIKSIPFMDIVDKVPLANLPFQAVHQDIAAGEAKVVNGSAKIAAGEKQLAEGKQELEHGQTHLSFINRIRKVCAVFTVIFAALFVGLGIYWRKALLR